MLFLIHMFELHCVQFYSVWFVVEDQAIMRKVWIVVVAQLIKRTSEHLVCCCGSPIRRKVWIVVVSLPIRRQIWFVVVAPPIRNKIKRSPVGGGQGGPCFILWRSRTQTIFQQRDRRRACDCLFNKSDVINDIYRFPQLLTTFSSEIWFECPIALITKVNQERKIRTELYSFIYEIYFLFKISITNIRGGQSYGYSVTELRN